MEWRKDGKYCNRSVSSIIHNKRKYRSDAPRGEVTRRQAIKHGNIAEFGGTTEAGRV